MPRRLALRFGILAIGAVISGGLLLGLRTTALQASPRWHGALGGALAGVYGLCLFGLGATWSTHRGTAAFRTRHDTSPSATPEEAKFWLRKFLEEQQKK